MDVVTTSIVQRGLVAAAKEMSATLERAAYNPLLFELKDYSAAIMSRDGKLWAEAPGLVGFLAAMPAIVQAGVERFGADGFAPGDVVLANDPFDTGTHVSDTTAYMPVFCEGRLIAFTALTAHWADVGGKTPGGWCSDSIDVFQEGLRLPHVKLHRAGELDDTLRDVILANVRLPDTVRGDLEAQIAACRTGAQRIEVLCRRYGPSVVEAAMAAACDASERALRARIRALPDGEYTASTVMEDDGVALDVERPLRLRLVIEGDRIAADLTGTSETAAGPINLPLAGSRGAVNAAIKALLAPREPTNDGEFRVVDFHAPEDTMVNPRPPGPCDSYGYVFEALVSLTLAALADLVPERVPGGAGQMVGIYLFRMERDGAPFIYVDPTTVGWGAHPGRDGRHLIFVLDGDTPNGPAEVVETRYPIRMTAHSLLPDRSGAGKHRGGPGLLREYEILDEGVLSQGFMGNDAAPPRGVSGGSPGAHHRIVLWPGTEREQVYRRRFGFGGPFAAGDRIRTEAGGGGGWGPPRERDPALVVEDVRDELVSVEEAAEVYGVVVERHGESLDVDEQATARLRAE